MPCSPPSFHPVPTLQQPAEAAPMMACKHEALWKCIMFSPLLHACQHCRSSDLNPQPKVLTLLASLQPARHHPCISARSQYYRFKVTYRLSHHDQKRERMKIDPEGLTSHCLQPSGHTLFGKPCRQASTLSHSNHTSCALQERKSARDHRGAKSCYCLCLSHPSANARHFPSDFL